MKISKTKLHQIIKEELRSIISEGDLPDYMGSTIYGPRSGKNLAGKRASDPLPITKKTPPADMEQRQKSDAAEVAKDPILNGRKLRKLFFGSKEAKKRLKTAQSEMAHTPEYETYIDEQGKKRQRTVPREPETAEEIYIAKSRAYDRLERKYHKMTGKEKDFDKFKSIVLSKESALEELANELQPHYDVIDLHTQLKGGYQGIIDAANDMIQELGREKMESLVMNPPLLRSFFEKFEASRVDPVKKRFASGEFPR